ncbi:uncharacterized protein [Salminus brasiliensis]|uniref:uncharacterized protein n=1 Tax=Salminus brasiliensis TaxID=930266 RepID=UPI003B82F26F
MFYGIRFWTLWLLVWHNPRTNGEDKCKNNLISSINVTSELQSDVLLPCTFEPTLLGSDKTADIAAVWSQRTIPVDNLIEIRLQGEVMFWTNRNGRIEPFPKLSASGNFSILLHNVSESDLGLYRCQLFEGINCSIAYQDIFIHIGSHNHSALAKHWPFIAGGGAVILTLLVVSMYCLRHPCKKASNESLYANTGFNQRKVIEPIEEKSRRNLNASGSKPRAGNPQKPRARSPKRLQAGSPREAPPTKPGVNEKYSRNCRNIYENKHLGSSDIYINQPR